VLMLWLGRASAPADRCSKGAHPQL